jgi:hypothetical protein
MPTFGELIDRVVTDLNRGADLSARVRAAVVDAIEFYSARRFAFNQARTTLTATASVEYLDLPDGWVEIDRVVLNDASGNRRLLRERNPGWIDEQEAADSDTGEPVVYAVDNRMLRLYPVTDSTYSLSVSYLKRLTEVSLSAADSVTNAWTTEGYLVIYARAMADMLESYIDGEESFAKAGLMRRREAEALRELERRVVREQGGGQIRPFM